jgi:hypothetical protein
MSEERPWRRLVACLADESALVLYTRVVLGKLGYGVLTPEELATLPPGLARMEPQAYLVDESRLADVPDDSAVPILLLTGPEGVREVDLRIFGAVRKPAGVHALYRLLQQALEAKPRGTLRAGVALAARFEPGEGEGEGFGGEILSLSEAGCLARASRPVRLGSEFELAFDLPGHGPIEVRAEAAYYQVADLGLVFSALPAQARSAVRDFVHARLLEP